MPKILKEYFESFYSLCHIKQKNITQLVTYQSSTSQNVFSLQQQKCTWFIDYPQFLKLCSLHPMLACNGFSLFHMFKIGHKYFEIKQASQWNKVENEILEPLLSQDTKWINIM
jgi:hypothetical protein